MESTLTDLVCTFCGAAASAETPQSLCPSCGHVLFARYDVGRLKSSLTREMLPGRPPTLWRYFEALPIRNPQHVVTLGEGLTPLLPLQSLANAFGVRYLHVKDEALNPTGTFKARGMAVAVSKAKELGLQTLIAPSAGNAGAALAAYGIRAGLTVHVVLPADTPPTIQAECRMYGAHVHLVDGLIDEAGRVARGMRENTPGSFDMSTLREPYRVEGKKTLGYELAEQLGWDLPDVIIYPTGGGTGLIGMWKAFTEMEALGWIGSARPRMVVVQADGCAPLVRAFERGLQTAEPWKNASTIAAGLRVPAAIGDYLILDIVRKSGGTCVAVSDDEILGGMLEFAREGILVCPEGAATLAGLYHLKNHGDLARDARVVIFNTGNGLKYREAIDTALENSQIALNASRMGAKAPKLGDVKS